MKYSHLLLLVLLLVLLSLVFSFRGDCFDVYQGDFFDKSATSVHKKGTYQECFKACFDIPHCTAISYNFYNNEIFICWLTTGESELVASSYYWHYKIKCDKCEPIVKRGYIDSRAKLSNSYQGTKYPENSFYTFYYCISGCKNLIGCVAVSFVSEGDKKKRCRYSFETPELKRDNNGYHVRWRCGKCSFQAIPDMYDTKALKFKEYFINEKDCQNSCLNKEACTGYSFVSKPPGEPQVCLVSVFEFGLQEHPKRTYFNKTCVECAFLKDSMKRDRSAKIADEIQKFESCQRACKIRPKTCTGFSFNSKLAECSLSTLRSPPLEDNIDSDFYKQKCG